MSRLARAVRRAATDDAVIVLRSFAEPPQGLSTNRAECDRSMLWGVVDVRSVQTLPEAVLMLTCSGARWQLSRSVFTTCSFPGCCAAPRPARAERMQAVLEEVGGLWVKLGQALALRFDILPADYCLQFFQLLNQIKPFPTDDARSIIEHELRRPVDALFRSFDWQPHAAASIGQVHRAELPDGTPSRSRSSVPAFAS